MAQPTFRDAQVGPSSISFATKAAVQVDFGTSGNAGVIVQALAFSFNTSISDITIGGTMSGGTTTGSVGTAGTTNIDGTISGGTSLTLETQAASSQIGTGNVRAGRAAGVTLTGVQWVQVVCADGNAKPTLTVATYDNCPTIAAGTAVSYLGTAFSQSVTTTTNDRAATVLYSDGGDGATITITSPAVQRLRGAAAKTSGQQSLVWDSAGLASSTTIAGTSGSTQGWQGTKWALSGSVAAPVLSAPTATATGPTQATIGVTSDTAPTTTTISFQILPAANAAPTAATIVGAPTGTITTGSAGALTKAITALTTNTAVKAHFAQGASSNVVSTASFTPNTIASSGSPSVQSGTAGGSFAWTGATPDSLVTNHGNGSGSWSIVNSVGFAVVPSINTSTGVLSGGTLSGAGTYAPQIRYTDSSTVPSAQQINFTLTLTVSSGTQYGFKMSTVAGLQFGSIVGALTGLGLRPVGEQYVATVHSAADHSVIVAQSGTLTMGSGGRLPDWSHPSIVNATSYFVSFRRVSDGATCSALLTSEAVP